MDDKKIGDDKFYSSLKKYSTLFYLGKGKPFFLVNYKWYSSFMTVIGCSLAYAFSIWYLFKSGYLMK
jgi:hypothetical protein